MRPGRRGAHTFYALLHGTRESVEVFTVTVRRNVPSLVWNGCIIAPDGVGLNSLAPLPDGGLYATNFLTPGPNLRAELARVQAGEVNGEVWEWHRANGWSKIPGTEMSGPNGIEISPDGQTLYVASWGRQAFTKWRKGTAASQRQSLPVGFRIDNLHRAPDGMILAVGQGEKLTKLVKIDPDVMKIVFETEIADTPSFYAGTGAVQVGNEIWIGSYRVPNVAVVRLPR